MEHAAVERVVGFLPLDHDAVPASRFRFIKRLVGQLQQPLRSAAQYRSANGHADAERHDSASPGGGMGNTQPRHRRAQLPGHLARVFGRHVVHDQREFLAAIAGGKVQRAAAELPQYRADPAQHLIAGLVAIGVVVRLEVVRIHHEDGHRAIIALCLVAYVARSYCVRRGLQFSTAYHTQFPEYLRARLPVPLGLSYRYMRWFHAAATWCLVGTPYLQKLLALRGFTNTAIWTKGVDTELFNPAHRTELPHGRPIFLYVGRVAIEKNIGAFLELDLPGTKLVVGGGPSLERLRLDYPEVVFAGQKQGRELAAFFASADAFVFPSRTDTFGLVLLEALASGTPVAAYPVTGPIDVIGAAPVGVLDDDLRAAALAALDVSREACRRHFLQFSWTASADQFLRHLPRIDVIEGGVHPHRDRRGQTFGLRRAGMTHGYLPGGILELRAAVAARFSAQGLPTSGRQSRRVRSRFRSAKIPRAS